MLQYLEWHWTCNNKKFEGKLDALKEQVQSKQAVHFHAPNVYNKYSLCAEPLQSWDDILKERALEIRLSCDYINLWFSGGCDSMKMLDTFVQNNIFIDEITMYKCGISDADYEINESALLYLEKIKNSIAKTKISIISDSEKNYKAIYAGKNWTYKFQNSVHYTFRPNTYTESYNFFQPKSNTVNLLGKDKPWLVYVDNKWYSYFLDANLNPMAGHSQFDIYFYADSPKVHAKQCHMLKRFIEKNLTVDQYNTTDKLMSCLNQTMINYASGRIDSLDHTKFVPKQQCNKQVIYEKNKYYIANQKDNIAINKMLRENHELVKLWKSGLDSLVEDIGPDWFNKSRPEFGTVGVFSKFYCLDEPGEKIVDELFPNGFFNDR